MDMSDFVFIVVDEDESKIFRAGDIINILRAMGEIIPDENVVNITGEGSFKQRLAQELKNVYENARKPVIFLDEDLEGEYGKEVLFHIMYDDISLQDAVLIPFSDDTREQAERLKEEAMGYSENKGLNIVVAEGFNAEKVSEAIKTFNEREDMREGGEGIEKE